MFFVAVWSAACHAAGSGSALTGRRGIVMPDLILDWGLFGSNGTNLNDGGTVDTGGVEVTLGFNAQDGDAFARYLEFDQYVDTASGETFDPMSALKLFGEGAKAGPTTPRPPRSTSARVMTRSAMRCRMFRSGSTTWIWDKAALTIPIS